MKHSHSLVKTRSSATADKPPNASHNTAMLHCYVCDAVLLTEYFISQFFIVPYSLIPGHDAKTIEHISAEHCAQLCVHDDLIVCRSFDYQVSDVLSCCDHTDSLPSVSW